MYNLFEVYAKEGKFYFDIPGQNKGDRSTVGPYDDQDKAEWDSCEAESTMG